MSPGSFGSQDSFDIKLKSVRSLIKSSKSKYKDWYLLIAEVEDLSIDKSVKGKRIEVLIPQTACFEEAKLAYLTHSKLTLSNLKKELLKPTPKKSDYDFFMKAIVNGQAGCKITKL